MTKLQINRCLECVDFPCEDVDHAHYLLPQVSLNPLAVRVVLISESVPANAADDYYAGARVSDAWATAMLCMGRDEGGPVAQAQSLPVFFIQQEGKKLITSESPALEKSTAVMIQR